MVKYFKLMVFYFFIVTMGHLLFMNLYISDNIHRDQVKLIQTGNACAATKNKTLYFKSAEANILQIAQSSTEENINLAREEAFKKAKEKLAFELSKKKSKAKLLNLEIAKQKLTNSKKNDVYVPIDANVIYAGNLSVNAISEKKPEKSLKLTADKNLAGKKTTTKSSPLIIVLKNIFTLSKVDYNQKQIIKITNAKTKLLRNEPAETKTTNISLLDEGIIALSYANATQYFLEGNLKDALKETNKILAIDGNNHEGLILLDKIEKNML